MTALVTGAAGFIGGHLATALVRRGERVRALLRYTSRSELGTLGWFPRELVDEIELVFGDLRDVESVDVAVAGVDTVFHLGAQIAIPYSYVNPRDFFETNVLGSLNVAQCARRAGTAHVLHASTSEVYGSAQFVPITERHPLQGQSPYAASKIGADKLMESFHRTYGLPVTIVRPFNTYGPHQSGRAIVPTVIGQALAGGPVRLGSLEPRRDLTYVEDTVAGFLAVEGTAEAIGQTVQLGTGTDVSVRDVVDTVAEALGRDLTVEHDPERFRPETSEVMRLVSDPSRAAELTGWVASTDLRTGVRKTLAWFQANSGRVVTHRYAT